MSKLGVIGTALRSNFTVRTFRASYGISDTWLLRQSPRRFSTEAEQPPQDSAVDSFLKTPDTDIINMLEGCNLTMDDVKVDYNWSFTPNGMMVQFPSRFAYDKAVKAIGRKGRLYRLDRADRSQWDLIKPYSGKTVLLQGLPRTAIPEDVERFLTGCEYDSSSIEMFLRSTLPDKWATVRFPSKTEAMNVFIKKNRGICHNNQILVRVLQ
uniref:Uncharacterized protein n=1 Tax=Fagus sylvatica TaxID=28930 RepID=A0A2N9F7M6_FAGSY